MATWSLSVCRKYNCCVSVSWAAVQSQWERIHATGEQTDKSSDNNGFCMQLLVLARDIWEPQTRKKKKLAMAV